MNTPDPKPFILGNSLHHVPPEVDAICLIFGRDEVTNPRIGRCVDDLLHLSTSRELTQRFASSVLFAFDGYNDDPREVHTIPECRAFLNTLNANWPYWMHFLAPIPDLWATFLLCLTPPALPVALSPNTFGREYDPDAFKALLFEQLQAMNNLHQHHALDVPTRQRIFQTAMQAINEATTELPPSP